MVARIPIDDDAIAAFCGKWKVTELSLFGSVLREDFTAESDVDVLVVFAEDAPWSLLDIAQMQIEMQDMFGRHVDIVEKRAIRNPFLRHNILKSYQTIYAHG